MFCIWVFFEFIYFCIYNIIKVFSYDINIIIRKKVIKIIEKMLLFNVSFRCVDINYVNCRFFKI